MTRRLFKWAKPVFIISALLLCSIELLYAQPSTLSIQGKPERSEDEIVAVRDPNGRFCAAVQVISDMDGFSYDAYNGVVRMDDMPGKDMVFLQPDERVLEIYHTGYEPLKIILSEVGIRLKEREVWKVRIAGEKEIAVVIITQPEGAEIFLDGQSMGSGKQHTLTIGSHQLRIVQKGYKPIVEAINVDEEHALFEYTLEEIEEVGVVITTQPDSAEVYIDEVKIGVTPLSDFYLEGRYPIRIEKEWYVTYQDSIEIKGPETQKEYVLQPDFGQVTVTSSPESNLDITLNGISQNAQTPHTFERLRPDTYLLSARSQYYEAEDTEIVLKRGEKREVKLNAMERFATLTINTHNNAIVYLNGKQIQQWKDIRLDPMRATIKVEMPKGESLTRRVALKKGDKTAIDLYPEVQSGTLQVVVTPLDALVELKGDAGEYYTSEGKGNFKDIPVGTYQLTVKHRAYQPHTESVVLKVGEKIKRSVMLGERMIFLKKPFYKTWWFWTAVGVSTAGGTLAIINRTQDQQTATTGIIEIDVADPK